MTRSLAALTGVAAGVLTLTAACGSTTDKSSSGSDDMARYVQTWSTDYDHTTCAQWNKAMTAAQRWTAAFEMLRDERASVTGIAKLPADSLVDRFETAVTTRCGSTTAAGKDIPDAAQDVYEAGKSVYGA